MRCVGTARNMALRDVQKEVGGGGRERLEDRGGVRCAGAGRPCHGAGGIVGNEEEEEEGAQAQVWRGGEGAGSRQQVLPAAPPVYLCTLQRG